MAVPETITVLFTDLVGSTEISYAISPDAADELLRTHFSVLRRAIAKGTHCGKLLHRAQSDCRRSRRDADACFLGNCELSVDKANPSRETSARRTFFGQHLIRRFTDSVTWIGITIQASTVFGFVLTAKRAGPGVL